MPSNALKPSNAIEINPDDMDIDENHNANTTKNKTLLSFYPSSIKASKELDKTMGVGLPMTSKTDQIMSDEDNDLLKLQRFKELCQSRREIGNFNSEAA